MSPEMNWSNFEIDQLKPICLFDVSQDEELREAFNWKNTQPLSKQSLEPAINPTAPDIQILVWLWQLNQIILQWVRLQQIY